ncbi:unnamed protein product [Echinostoma caproni]|uniref:G_PROTEIN_RECEP_F1_2 domain-containing protein n=1 Tax=Echinostoma caproni TaxID=27848 RepID=A0A183A994_9TREM|nr:unnamed protein product [Echinostoma caproni]
MSNCEYHRWTRVFIKSIILQILIELCMQVLGDSNPSTSLPASHQGKPTETINSSLIAVAPISAKPRTSVLVTSCVCIAIAIVGVLGNLLVICVLIGSHTRLVYETFCVGLAVTDLTYLTFTTPITIVQYYFRGWIFGLFWCKVFNFVVQVTVFSSAFMLLGLTTSRFLSVVLPWQNLKMTELQAKLFCLGAWIAGVIFASPVLVFQVLMPSREVTRYRHSAPGKNMTTTCLDVTEAVSNETMEFRTMTTVQESVVLCRGLFPSQSSRMGYQLLVLLSTYVIPFVAILIMNSTIIYKLQQRNVMERHERARKRQPDSSLSIRNNILFRRKRASKSKENSQLSSGDPGQAVTSRASSEHQLELEPFQPTEAVSGPNRDSFVTKNTTLLNPMELVKMQKAEKKRRTRTKATKLVVLVTTLWCVCWLPTHIINSWLNFDEASFPFTPEMVASKLVSQTLSFAASCVNPVVYGIMTGTFKATISNKMFRRRHKLDEKSNGAAQRTATLLENLT